MKMNPIFLLIFIIGLLAFQQVPNCVDIPVNELSEDKSATTLNQADILNIHSKLERGYLIIQTVGNSMLGVINPNQRCLCVVKEEYSVGDIILFLNQNTGVAHEIIYQTSSGFITKGTNNEFADGEIHKSQALCSIPYLSRWELW